MFSNRCYSICQNFIPFYGRIMIFHIPHGVVHSSPEGRLCCFPPLIVAGVLCASVYRYLFESFGVNPGVTLVGHMVILCLI